MEEALRSASGLLGPRAAVTYGKPVDLIDTQEVRRAALEDVATRHDQKDVHIRREPKREWATAALFLFLALAGLVAGRLGLIWPDFDVFSQLTPQFGLAALAFTLAIFFSKRMTTTKGFVLLLLFCAAYGAIPMLRTFAMSAPKEDVIIVQTFNLFKSNKNISGLRKSIEKSDPDILTLIEITNENIGVLEELRSRYKYQSVCPEGQYCSQMIVSKFPVTQVNLEYEPNVLTAVIEHPKGNISVAAVHMKRFPYSKSQFKETILLTKVIEKMAFPKIVAGDFNATPYSRITQMIADQSDLSRLTSQPTWPATIGIPQVAIDHIFVSREFEAASKPVIGDAAGSDHYPIAIGLRLKPKAN